MSEDEICSGSGNENDADSGCMQTRNADGQYFTQKRTQLMRSYRYEDALKMNNVGLNSQFCSPKYGRECDYPFGIHIKRGQCPDSSDVDQQLRLRKKETRADIGSCNEYYSNSGRMKGRNADVQYFRQPMRSSLYQDIEFLKMENCRLISQLSSLERAAREYVYPMGNESKTYIKPCQCMGSPDVDQQLRRRKKETRADIGSCNENNGHRNADTQYFRQAKREHYKVLECKTIAQIKDGCRCFREGPNRAQLLENRPKRIQLMRSYRFEDPEYLKIENAILISKIYSLERARECDYPMGKESKTYIKPCKCTGSSDVDQQLRRRNKKKADFRYGCVCSLCGRLNEMGLY